MTGLMTAVIPAPDVPVCHCNARLPGQTGHTHSATPGEIFAHVSAGGRGAETRLMLLQTVMRRLNVRILTATTTLLCPAPSV